MLKKRLSLLMLVIMLFSFFGVSASAVEEYTVNGIEILSEDFLPLSEITYGEEVGISVNITKNTYSTDSAYVMLAAYDASGAMAEVSSLIQKDFAPGQTLNLRSSVTAVEGGYVKAFVWEGATTPSPLSNSATKKFSEFLFESDKADTTDTLRIRGTVKEASDSVITIKLSKKYDSINSKWVSASSEIAVNPGEFTYLSENIGLEVELYLDNYPLSPTVVSVNSDYVAEMNPDSDISLMAATDTYYSIDGISILKADGTPAEKLAAGEKAFAGAYVTRIDAGSYIQPYISIELRDGNGKKLGSTLIDSDKFTYNQSSFVGFMFTVPEDTDASFIRANVYDSISCTEKIADQVISYVSDYSQAEPSADTISVKGRFKAVSENTADIAISEALVRTDGTLGWTSDFADYISASASIDLNNIDISNALGYEAIFELEISDAKNILKSVQKIENSKYIEVADIEIAVGGDYTEAAEILKAIGVTDGESLGKATTRADLAKLLVNITGNSSLAKTYASTAMFGDVDVTDENNGYYVAAVKLGLMSQFADTSFMPDTAVRYSEILEAAEKALGNKESENYTIDATTDGLTSGITATADQGLNLGSALIVLYNALSVPIRKDGTATNELLLNKIGVTRFEGVIEATPVSDNSIQAGKVRVTYSKQYTAVAGNSAVQKYTMDMAEMYANPSNIYGSLISSFKRATVNASDEIQADSFLDYGIEMYVKDATTANAELLYIAPTEMNSTVSFNASDIADIYLDDDGSNVYGTVAVYDENDKPIEYDLYVSRVYVNGREQDIDGSYLRSASAKKAALRKYFSYGSPASVKLLCNTAGEEYNIVYITYYTDIVVDSVNEATATVTATYPMDNVSRVMFSEDYAGRYKILKDGKEVSFSDIKAGDVLSIAGYVNSSTKELEYGTVIITDERATGIVSAYDPDACTVTVGGKAYPYNATIGGMIGAYGGISLGDEVSLYMNCKGWVIDIDKSYVNPNFRYGFATRVVKTSGLDDLWQIRVLKTDNEWETFNFADNVSFDGSAKMSTSSMSVMAMLNYLNAYNINGAIAVNDIIAYETNANGEIHKIFVYEVMGNADATFNAVAANGNYIASTGGIGSAYINDDTTVFTLSAGINPATDIIRDDDVYAGDKSMLTDRANYSVTGYGVNNDGYASVLFGSGLFEIPEEPDVPEVLSELKYGFATRVVMSAGIEDLWQIKILSTDNEWEVLTFADRVSFDGYAKMSTSAMSASAMLNYLNAYNINGAIALNDIIAYRTNSNGEIVEIDVTESGNTDLYDIFNYKNVSDTYDASTGKISDIYLNDDTAVYTVAPYINLATDIIGNEDVYAGDRSLLTNGEFYNAKGYGVGADSDVKVLFGSGLFEIPEEPDVPEVLSELKYGFATKVVMTAGVETAWQMKVLGTDGVWKALTFADRVSFDGNHKILTSNIYASEMQNYLNAFNIGGYLAVNDIIGYKTNSKGEIAKIYINERFGDIDAEFNALAANAEYIASTGEIGSMYLNDDTAIFSIAGGVNPATTIIAEEDIVVSNKKHLIDRFVYNVVGYGADDEGFVKVLAGSGLVGEINMVSDFFVINGITSSTNENGDDGYLISGIVKGENETVFVNNTETIVKDAVYDGIIIDYEYTAPNNFRKGDVILYSELKSGEANNVVRLLSNNNAADIAYQLSGADPNYNNVVTTYGNAPEVRLAEFAFGGEYYTFCFGFAYDRVSNRIKLSSDTSGSNIFTLAAPSDAGARVDNFASKITVADAEFGEIDTDSNGYGYGDLVFARAIYGTNIEDFVIYDYND